MKSALIHLLAMICILPNYVTAEEKVLPKFRVVGSEPGTHTILLPKETTTEQLSDLLTAFACTKRLGTLMEIGIPPTTPLGRQGPYALVNLYLFKDPASAGMEQLKKWIAEDADSKAARAYAQKIEGYFQALPKGEETISIGYSEGGRPLTRGYRSLSPIPDSTCQTTSFTSPFEKKDDVAAFLRGPFAKKYNLQRAKSWPLKQGSENITFKSTTNPALDVTVVAKLGRMESRSLAFNLEYSLDSPEWEIIDAFLHESVPLKDGPKASAFVKQHIEQPIKEKTDPSGLILSMSSYFTQRLGDVVLRCGRNRIPRLIIETPSPEAA